MAVASQGILPPMLLTHSSINFLLLVMLYNNLNLRIMQDSLTERSPIDFVVEEKWSFLKTLWQAPDSLITSLENLDIAHLKTFDLPYLNKEELSYELLKLVCKIVYCLVLRNARIIKATGFRLMDRSPFGGLLLLCINALPYLRKTLKLSSYNEYKVLLKLGLRFPECDNHDNKNKPTQEMTFIDSLN